MKAQGIDFGGYTKWKRSAIRPGVQVDFVICGIGWGNSPNTTWEHNKPEIMKEDRRLIYQFFNHAPSWESQADFILKEYEDIDAHSIAIDCERDFYGLRPDLNMKAQANKILSILNKVKNNTGGKVQGYSNFYDYWLISQHVNFDDWDWWFADPDDNPDDHPGSFSLWMKYAKTRILNDYHFDQYGWKAYALDYGAVNNKKSMDLTQFKYDLDALDVYLGLASSPPVPDPNKDYNQGLDDLYAKTTEAHNQLRKE